MFKLSLLTPHIASIMSDSIDRRANVLIACKNMWLHKHSAIIILRPTTIQDCGHVPADYFWISNIMSDMIYKNSVHSDSL